MSKVINQCQMLNPVISMTFLFTYFGIIPNG